MKTLKSLFAICAVAALIASCEKPCEIYCQNGAATNTEDCSCDCPPGFTGANCQNRSCTTTCQNGGTLNSSCGCNCPSGYTGTNCQTTLCQANNWAYVYFENKSTTGTAYSVVWDGVNLETLAPGKRGVTHTVAKGQHTLKFTEAVITNTGVIVKSTIACTQSTINLAQCTTSGYYCKH